MHSYTYIHPLHDSFIDRSLQDKSNPLFVLIVFIVSKLLSTMSEFENEEKVSDPATVNEVNEYNELISYICDVY